MIDVCVFECNEGVFIFCVMLTIIPASHSTITANKQQGGEVMDDSVKQWWPKVAAAAGAADTEQAILELEGV